MQYHLDTIPLWEVLEQHAECPFCALYHHLEETEVQRALGGSVMEPDVRVQVNKRGFCATHHRQLLAQNNRLGHALLTDSHMKELLKKTCSLSPAGWPPKAHLDALIEKLQALSSGCVLCDALALHMNRYYATFLHLWKTDKKFQALWDASHGACMPHGAELLRHAQKHLSLKKQQVLAGSVLALLNARLTQDEKDLEYFTTQFDYRNQNRPWGDSKTALERSLRRLRGGFAEEHFERDGETRS